MFHLAILRQPFFNMILDGQKTIESRFSFNKIVPYQTVNVGDIIYLKETGKQVTAKCKVSDVKFFELTPQIVEDIRMKYGKQIGTDQFEDWETTKTKKYCTLIWICDIEKIKPISVPRSNGGGWFVLKQDLLGEN